MYIILLMSQSTIPFFFRDSLIYITQHTDLRTRLTRSQVITTIISSEDNPCTISNLFACVIVRFIRKKKKNEGYD